MTALPIHRVMPHVPTALVWVLALALGVQAALIVRNLIPQPKSTPAQMTAQASSTGLPPGAMGNSRVVDLQGVINAHLFGDATAEPSTANSADAPKTQLSLVLAGTIAVDDPAKGIALIGESAAAAKVFAVGAVINGGPKVHEVYTDRVILDRGGQLEALYLPRQMAGQPSMRRPPPPQQPTAGAALANRVRQMVAEDPGSIAEVMRPQPVFVDGKQRGFRVYPGRNREHFSRLGLQPGDLVMTINGTPLDDPARGMEIFKSMGSASQVSVTIERGGRKQDLVLDMAQLANQAQELRPGNVGNNGNIQ